MELLEYPATIDSTAYRSIYALTTFRFKNAGQYVDFLKFL